VVDEDEVIGSLQMQKMDFTAETT